MEKGARFPTTEVLGYCRMSLRDKNNVYLLQIGGLHPNGPRDEQNCLTREVSCDYLNRYDCRAGRDQTRAHEWKIERNNVSPIFNRAGQAWLAIQRTKALA